MNAGDTQHPDRQQLQAFSQGRVAPSEQTVIQSHLDGCPACCQALVQLADDDPFVARLRRVKRQADSSNLFKSTPRGIRIDTSADDTPALFRDPHPPDVVSAKSTRRDSTLPEVPGYEIIAELGRGGMGVVYKARQLGLNRLVALKVLLAGKHASPDDLARFRGEAEAVAQLRHEHVVQIHDIGAHNGLPYFALELCDGGSLAEHADGQPQPPREAARLVESLARAVQAAHQLGIVHRDLKPANILLQKKDKETPRQGDTAKVSKESLSLSPCLLVFLSPKIADFGLAKWVEHDSGLTGTNAVLGTPSYMAPEQAAGQGKNVGPAADIYALGAILYELLTGWPPLRGPTPLDTIQLVKTTEPIAPSRVQPGVPRDLETIVLKCLQKDPRHRYPTASALAQDLGCFLEGKPIAARPISSAERLFRWAKRNPGIAALTAAVMLLMVLVTVVSIVSAETYRQQAEIAGKARENARLEADTAKQISEFLTGLFEEMDPIAFGGRSFGLGSKNIDRQAVIGLLERGKDKLKGMLHDRPEVRASLLDRIGVVYVALGRCDLGKPLLEEALELRLKTLGEEHADVATSYLNLGDCFLMLDVDRNDPRTTQYYRKALALRRQHFGLDDARTAEVLFHLGALEGLLGKAEGEQLLVQAKAMYARHFGVESREYLQVLFALAEVHLGKKDLAKLLPLVPQIMTIMKKQPNVQELERALNLYMQGRMVLLVGKSPERYKKAKECWEEALTIAEPILGEMNLMILEARKQLAYHMHNDMRDYADVISHWATLADRYRKLSPQGSESEGTMLYYLYASQADAGWWAEAERTRLRAIVVNRAFSKDDRSRFFARLLYDEGNTLARHGKLEEAAAILKEAAEESRKGERWWFTGACADDYADKLEKLGRQKAARAVLEEYLPEVAPTEKRLSNANGHLSQAFRLAWLSRIVGDNPQALTKEEAQKRLKYQDECMVHLRAASSKGFGDWKFLFEHPHLLILRNREDFRKLITEMQQVEKK